MERKVTFMLVFKGIWGKILTYLIGMCNFFTKPLECNDKCYFAFSIAYFGTNTVKKMDIRIAVDDFGSGYSNFSHIIKLNPDYLKIDGSLIKNIDKEPKTFAVAKATNSFAKDINIKTVAEFIHSKEVYEKAKTLGIDGYQGFYLGEPQSADEIFNQK